MHASTGQNAVSQAKLFHEAVGCTFTLLKLDGTAKGGVIFSVADQFGSLSATLVSANVSQYSCRFRRTTL
ncbi:hypothetical protein ACLK1Z_19770 [Escherichia coli]